MPCGNPHLLNLSNHMMTRVIILYSANWPIRGCHVTIFQNETLTLIFLLSHHYHADSRRPSTARHVTENHYSVPPQHVAPRIIFQPLRNHHHRDRYNFHHLPLHRSAPDSWTTNALQKWTQTLALCLCKKQPPPFTSSEPQLHYCFCITTVTASLHAPATHPTTTPIRSTQNSGTNVLAPVS